MKRRMKGWLALVSAAGMCSPLTAYAAPTAALTAVERMAAAYQEMPDVHLTVDSVTNQTIEGEDVESSLAMDVKATQFRIPEQAELLSETKIRVFPITITYQTYYKDGITYVGTSGNWSSSTETPAQTLAQASALAGILQADPDLYAHTTLWIDGEEDLLELELNPGAGSQILPDLLSLLNMRQEEGITYQMEEGKIDYTISPEGTLSHIDMELDYTAGQGEAAQNYQIQAQIQVSAPGEAVEIQAPDLGAVE